MYQLLRLRQFRSYMDYSLELSDGVNIVFGPNASGKTNLLEAVYMISRGRSWRDLDRVCIANDHDWARLDATTDQQTRSLRLAPPRTKRLLIDDKELRRNEWWRYLLPVVLFDPDALRLLRGSPERRRGYLDDVLGQSDESYALALRRYQRALSQRNALLKQRVVATDQLFVWDVELAKYGQIIQRARLGLIEELNHLASKIYSVICGAKTRLEIEYRGDIQAKDYQSGLMKALHQRLARDRELGYTSAGPHRDDLRFSLDGEDAHTRASRGETRSVVLSLKIIEARIIEKKLDVHPLMLLDDVYSELDASRRRHLTEYLQDRQTIITTTDADAVMEHFAKNTNVIPLARK